MHGVAEGMAERIGALYVRRYPTLLVLLSPECYLSETEGRKIAQAAAIDYVDYREDVLAQADSGIILGAYLRSSFLNWLRAQARARGGLIVAHADDLVATWEDLERRAFFKEFMRTECNMPDDPTRRAPIVLLSWLAKEHVSPSEERGQGIVWDPAIEHAEGESEA